MGIRKIKLFKINLVNWSIKIINLKFVKIRV